MTTMARPPEKTVQPATPTAPARATWAPAAAAVVVLLAYAVFLAIHFVPALSEPDDHGYFAQGSLLADTGRTWFKTESDAQYVGMHWLLTPDGKYVSRYPPGLAVAVALVDKVAGWKAAGAVNPVLGLLGVAIDAEPPLPARRVHDLEVFLGKLAVLRPSEAVAGAGEWQAAKQNVLTFAPEGPRGVAAYVDGQLAASV